MRNETGKGRTPRETASPQKPKLLDQVRNKCQLRHYSIRTEQAYGDWAKKFILFHHKRHPLTMGTRSRSVSDASRR